MLFLSKAEGECFMQKTASDEDLARIRAAFEKNPRQMTMILARDLNVSEADVMRALANTLSHELDSGRWEEIIRDFEGFGKLHVICSNGAVTLESFGLFGNFSTRGEFFNVQTASLDMHIRFKNLGSIFAVRKPGHLDGVNTLSVQFFDKEGHSAFKVFMSFGGAAPSEDLRAQFQNLCDKFIRK
jgi:putative heme iron utilization protein